MAGNSIGGKKGNLTRKEKYGDDYFKRIGAIGGRARKRGHFGKLKDEGKIDELKALTQKGAKASNTAQGSKRKRSRPVPPPFREEW